MTGTIIGTGIIIRITAESDFYCKNSFAKARLQISNDSFHIFSADFATEAKASFAILQQVDLL